MEWKKFVQLHRKNIRVIIFVGHPRLVYVFMSASEHQY